jgi:proliferating cell nuclear antigen
MKLTLAEPKYLKDSITIISELVTEGTFKITKNSIELIAMDPANVAMVIFKLLSSAFTEYDIKEETEIAINLSNLKQILRRAGPNDMLTLTLDDNKLKIQLKGKNTRTFSLPIIEVEEKQQKVPELKFPLTIETSCENMSSAIEDADIVSDSLAFVVDKKEFMVEAEGDMNNAKVELNDEEDTKITVDSQDKIRAKYSIDYLKKMIMSSKLMNLKQYQHPL